MLCEYEDIAPFFKNIQQIVKIHLLIYIFGNNITW